MPLPVQTRAGEERRRPLPLGHNDQATRQPVQIVVGQKPAQHVKHRFGLLVGEAQQQNAGIRIRRADPHVSEPHVERDQDALLPPASVQQC